jgi:flagellar hook-length control protein FliK
METLPVQNAIVATAPPANPAAGAPAVTATAVETTADDAATPTPRGFGALLALQLGGAAAATAAAAATDDLKKDEAVIDGNPGAAVAIDPLAGLMLPALQPASAAAPLPNGGTAATVATGGSRLDNALDAATGAGEHTAAGAGDARGQLRAGAEALPATTTPPSAPANRSGDAAGRARDSALLQAAMHAAERPAANPETPATPSALLAQLTAAAAPAATTVTPAQAALDARVGTPEWNTELGQKIVWMVGARQQVAELSVNPPDLGPLDIKLTIDGGQTTAVFTSPHGAVRDALETALPRLREVLADSGIMLGNASVTADTPRDSRAFDEQRPGARGAAPGARERDQGAAAAPLRIVSSTRGLVDLFA